MKRRLFTILSALSLLLFVAVCVMWVRSYWVADTITYVHRDEPQARWLFLTSSRGRFGFATYWFAFPKRPLPDWATGRLGWRRATPVHEQADDLEHIVWARAGVRLQRIAHARQSLSLLSFPCYWMVLPVLLSLGATTCLSRSPK